MELLTTHTSSNLFLECLVRNTTLCLVLMKQEKLNLNLLLNKFYLLNLMPLHSLMVVFVKQTKLEVMPFGILNPILPFQEWEMPVAYVFPAYSSDGPAKP